VADAPPTRELPADRFKRWLLQERVEEVQGPEAKERGLGGATVFRGFMGYAPHADIATAGILRLAENLPVVVDIVDSYERVEAFLPFLRRAVKTGMVVSSEVEAEQVVPAEGAQEGLAAVSPPFGPGSTCVTRPPSERRWRTPRSAPPSRKPEHTTSRCTTGLWASTAPQGCSPLAPCGSIRTCRWWWKLSGAGTRSRPPCRESRKS
jgi:PII-like signaling protein